MHWPIVAILLQPCWGFFHLLLPFLWKGGCKSLHEIN
jgi:hypothetical protein